MSETRSTPADIVATILALNLPKAKTDELINQLFTDLPLVERVEAKFNPPTKSPTKAKPRSQKRRGRRPTARINRYKQAFANGASVEDLALQDGISPNSVTAFVNRWKIKRNRTKGDVAGQLNDILDLLASGEDKVEIAAALRISLKSVEQVLHGAHKDMTTAQRTRATGIRNGTGRPYIN